jgi:hypothetical protein
MNLCVVANIPTRKTKTVVQKTIAHNKPKNGEAPNERDDSRGTA